MKKSLLILAIIGMFFISCDKDDENTPDFSNLPINELLTVTTWDFVKAITTSPTGTITWETGVPHESPYTRSISCEDGTSKSIKIESTAVIDYVYLTYNDDGSYDFKSKSSYTRINEEVSTCDNIVYKNGIEEENSLNNGWIHMWSYDTNTELLTMIDTYVHNSGTIEVEETEHQIEYINGQFIITETDLDNGVVTYESKSYYKPKQ